MLHNYDDMVYQMDACINVINQSSEVPTGVILSIIFFFLNQQYVILHGR